MKARNWLGLAIVFVFISCSSDERRAGSESAAASTPLTETDPPSTWIHNGEVAYYGTIDEVTCRPNQEKPCFASPGDPCPVLCPDGSRLNTLFFCDASPSGGGVTCDEAKTDCWREPKRTITMRFKDRSLCDRTLYACWNGHKSQGVIRDESNRDVWEFNRGLMDALGAPHVTLGTGHVPPAALFPSDPCGNRVCDKMCGETTETCPGDCPVDCQQCRPNDCGLSIRCGLPVDCGYCNEGVCDALTGQCTDYCGDHKCGEYERAQRNCCLDCGCEAYGEGWTCDQRNVCSYTGSGESEFCGLRGCEPLERQYHNCCVDCRDCPIGKFCTADNECRSVHDVCKCDCDRNYVVTYEECVAGCLGRVVRGLDGGFYCVDMAGRTQSADDPSISDLVCGDGICISGVEDCSNCPNDCGCGGGGGSGGSGGGGCTTNAPTQAPSLVAPIGCFAPASTFTFSWSNVAGARDYKLALADVTDPANEQQLFYDVVNGTSMTLPLSAERRYGWKVKGQNCAGPGPFSEASYFTVSADCRPPAAAPTPIAPHGCVDAVQPTFSWTAVPNTTSYRVVVSPADHDDFFIDRFVTGTSLVSPVALTPQTAYRLKVRAVNDAGPSPWSEIAYFTPFCNGVASTIISPVGCIDTATPTFVWKPMPPAIEYWLLVADSSDFSASTTTWSINQHLTGTSLFTPPGVVFTPGKTYYAKVKTILTPTSTTAAQWSPTISFTPLCASTNPVGYFDLVAPALGGLRVVGWALDADTTDAIPVHVYVDNVFVGATVANTSRPDVDAVYHTGQNHGFDFTIYAPTTGTVCVYAMNAGGGANPSIGCRAVPPPLATPIGAFDAAMAVPGGVRVVGWVLDPDTRNPIDVHVYVDNVFAGSQIASLSRPDVDAVHGMGAAHGFDFLVNTAGSNVCLYAIQWGAGINPQISCKQPH